MEELQKHLKEKGKTASWISLANEFSYLVGESDKKRSDGVRRMFNKLSIKVDNTKIHITLGCVHVPFHNEKLINSLLAFISEYKDKIGGFHLIGDFLDLKSLSSHDDGVVDKSGLTLGKEYSEGNRVLDMFDAILPNVPKTFIFGNHEDRYFRTISSPKANKFADALISPLDALKLKERGYKVLDNWKEDYISIGKYQAFHGIYCTQTPAKTHVSKLKHSCIFAHTHRIDQYFEGELHGVNIGCFADIESSGFKYLSRIERKFWKNGFGITHVNGKQSHTEVIVCENSRFFYAGKQY